MDDVMVDQTLLLDTVVCSTELGQVRSGEVRYVESENHTRGSQRLPTVRYRIQRPNDVSYPTYISKVGTYILYCDPPFRSSLQSCCLTITCVMCDVFSSTLVPSAPGSLHV